MPGHHEVLSESELSTYDYIDNSNKPITPISEHDKRKLDHKYRLPEISTTTERYEIKIKSHLIKLG